jgi:hypothetical protein
MSHAHADTNKIAEIRNSPSRSSTPENVNPIAAMKDQKNAIMRSSLGAGAW